MQNFLYYKKIAKKVLPLVIVLFFISPYNAFAFTSQDIFSFKRVEFVNPSPDGRRTVIATSEITQSKSAWQRNYSLYLSDSDKNVSLLNNDSNIAQPTWSPDGRYVAYINTNIPSAIYVIKIANNQKVKLTSFKGSISAFKWSPDSNSIAYVANADESPISANTILEAGKENLNARLYLKRLTSSDEATPITSNKYSISGSFNDAGFDWSPDGNLIAFSSQPEIGWNHADKVKIQLLNINTKQVSTLPYLKDHYANNPVFSTDGNWLAFRTNAETKDTNTNINNNIFYVNSICAVNLKSLKEQCLTETPNNNATILGWNRENTGVYALDFLKSEGIKIYELFLDNKINTKLTSTTQKFIEPNTISFNQDKTKFGFGLESTAQAPEAFVADTKNFKLEQQSRLNNSIQIGTTQDINWRSADGKKIEGLLITPTNYDRMKQYPLVVWIHGGPVGAAWKRYLGGCDEYENMIDPSSCWGNYLKEGYIVLAPNYRGSTGYGTDFRTASYRDLGGGDYEDIEAGVDYLVGKNLADAKNLFITGWSYGGYLTAWAIGQNTRYKAAVEGDGLTDLLSFSGTSDIPNYTSIYLGAMFWDDAFLYVKRSPIVNVSAIQTPILIFGGQEDVRVPIEQGIELYTALRRLNKPVKLMIFPGQGHLPQNPNMILDATIQINSWFNTARSAKNGK